jgi:CheY-like chemotaxis protein
MGLGLGLALVKSIVELHGGTIAARSPGEGKGATFTITLPRISTQTRMAAVQLPKVREALPLKGKKVLVVEDDADVRELLAAALQMAGAETAEAGSVAEALAALNTLVPDVLISDIGMPEEDGFIMIGKFRWWEREHRREPAPAIALTGYAQPEDHARCRSAGYNDHLSKPIEPEMLISAVLRVSGRNR